MPLLTAGCLAAGDGVGQVQEGIIGGTNDVGDPAVVLLYMTVPGVAGGSLCTAELISPHVLLTAAHCTGGENPATAATAHWQVYLGNDFSQATQADLIPVKEAHFDPAFDINNLPAGHDVGVAILQNPLSITPLAINRASLDGYDGATVRFVGYGLNSVTIGVNGQQSGSGAGVQRTTATTLSDHNSLLLHFSDGAHETCNGDSGGPAFMSIGGKIVIAGLTSYGDVTCNKGGYDTRVDAVASWIDGYVRPIDPAFASSDTGGSATSTNGSPSPSGGSQSPPTSSATPMPPSSAGAGGVGASCTRDSDCQSGICGSDANGVKSCAAPNANDGLSSYGCSAAGGDGASGFGLFLTLVLVGSLGRASFRARRTGARP